MTPPTISELEELLREKIRFGLEQIEPNAFTQVIKGFPEAAQAIHDRVASRWYRPADGLPEEGQMIWFQLGHLAPKMILTGRYYQSKFWWLAFIGNKPRVEACENVIHWMPITRPQPPTTP